MKTFTVRFDVELQSETKEQAVAKFAKEYLRKYLPSVEVLVAEGTENDMPLKSAAELAYLHTPKTKYLWRMEDYNTFEEAQADGAIYPVDADIHSMDIFRVINNVQECMGVKLHLVLSER